MTFLTSALAACASAGHRSGPCALRAQDSTYTASAAVYRDCAVDRKAELVTTRVRPELGELRPRSGCRSAEIEFVVSPGGSIELGTARIIHETDRDFAQAVMAVLPLLRYRPAMVGGTPVRQIATYKSQVATVLVAVPAGSGPPSRPPSGTPTPSC